MGCIQHCVDAILVEIRGDFQIDEIVGPNYLLLMSLQSMATFPTHRRY